MNDAPAGPFVVGFAVTDFVCFALALRLHFRAETKMPAGMRVLSALSVVFFALFLLLACGRSAWGGAGASASLLLFAASLAIFVWSVRTTRHFPPLLAFSTTVPQSVYTAGPYRFIRHPFYASYIVFWFGTGIATASPVGWIGPAILTTIYVGAARREERDFASSTAASTYRVLQAGTGMLFPRMPSLHRRQDRVGRSSTGRVRERGLGR